MAGLLFPDHCCTECQCHFPTNTQTHTSCKSMCRGFTSASCILGRHNLANTTQNTKHKHTSCRSMCRGFTSATCVSLGNGSCPWCRCSKANPVSMSRKSAARSSCFKLALLFSVSADLVRSCVHAVDDSFLSPLCCNFFA